MNYDNKEIKKTGEVAPYLNHLLYKFEDQSMNPQQCTHIKDIMVTCY